MKQLCIRLGFVLGLLGLAGSSVAWGQDTHYQDYIMGQRAAGMGGAFTGLANDPSAGFYNPAGFATGEGIQVGIGLTLYGFEYRNLENGLSRPEGASNLERLEIVVFPSAGGVAARFGPRDKTGKPVWGVGFSILMPYRTQIRFRSTLDQVVNSSRRQATYILHRDDQTFMAGPSLARRIGPVSIGVAILYTHRTFGWALAENDALSKCRSTRLQECIVDSINSVSSNLEGWIGQLNFRAGVLIKFNETWQLGLSTSLSSIRLWGDGSFFLQRFSVPRDVTKTPVQNFIRLPGGLDINSPLPWEARAGLVYRPLSRLTLSLDVVFHSPLNYPLIGSRRREQKNSSLSKISDLFQHPLNIRRKLLFNVNFGGEFMISPVVPLRWGFFTNLSSAPDVPDRSFSRHLPQIHMFGASTSIGVRMWRISFDFGVSVSYGVGQGQRFIPGDIPVFEAIPFRQMNVHIYLAGATEMLGQSLEALWRKVSSAVRKNRQPKTLPRPPVPSLQPKPKPPNPGDKSAAPLLRKKKDS